MITTTPEGKLTQTQEVIPTSDTKSSLGIYSMTAPSSVISSAKSLDFDSFVPKPTNSEANKSSSITTETQTFEKSHTHGRRPILVTGYPNTNPRQIHGKWVDDSNTNVDTMPRIPITTPHSTTKKTTKKAAKKIINVVEGFGNQGNVVEEGSYY